MRKSFNIRDIMLIAGLGNPGNEYAATRHNAGAFFIDKLARAMGVSGSFMVPSGKHFALAKAGAFILVRTTTFMNESGMAIAEALRYCNVPPSGLLLVHDDSDIMTGDSKLQFRRGAAGHRGVQSVIDHLHTNAFWRLRIGVRPVIRFPFFLPRKKAEEFILRPFTERECYALEARTDALIEELFPSRS